MVEREQGTGNREQGTGNREQGTGNREQGTGNREQKNGVSCSLSFNPPGIGSQTPTSSLLPVQGLSSNPRLSSTLFPLPCSPFPLIWSLQTCPSLQSARLSPIPDKLEGKCQRPHRERCTESRHQSTAGRFLDCRQRCQQLFPPCGWCQYIGASDQ